MSSLLQGRARSLTQPSRLSPSPPLPFSPSILQKEIQVLSSLLRKHAPTVTYRGSHEGDDARQAPGGSHEGDLVKAKRAHEDGCRDARLPPGLVVSTPMPSSVGVESAGGCGDAAENLFARVEVGSDEQVDANDGWGSVKRLERQRDVLAEMLMRVRGLGGGEWRRGGRGSAVCWRRPGGRRWRYGKAIARPGQIRGD